MTPFVGIEDFFIPAELDNRLGGFGGTWDEAQGGAGPGSNRGPSAGTGGDAAGGDEAGDIWW
jgi:hypothetical protein